MKILKLIPCIGVHGSGLLAWCFAFNLHFLFCLNFRSVPALSHFLLYIFPCLRAGTHPVSKTLCSFVFLEYRTMAEFQIKSEDLYFFAPIEFHTS
jgi:hypothetical protein